MRVVGNRLYCKRGEGSVSIFNFGFGREILVFFFRRGIVLYAGRGLGLYFCEFFREEFNLYGGRLVFFYVIVDGKERYGEIFNLDFF